MHSCNYVVFEKFTCAYYHQIVLKSYYLNRIPLKCCMDYIQGFQNEKKYQEEILK